ncbi:MAG: SOS response-associated peptidase [Lachnotalea sp.]
MIELCGRYYIDEETAVELQKIVANLDRKMNLAKYVGDVVPSAKAPVLIAHNTIVSLELLSWGLKNYYSNGLIINARAETVSEKKAFRDCLGARRCIIPAKGFYEWDESRNKFKFYNKNETVMYLAGLYDEENRFVILTTKANQSMEKVHPRMPVVLRNEWIKPWLMENKETNYILNEVPPLLDSKTEMQQMRLEF